MQAIGLAKIPEEKYADLCSLQKSYITNGHQNTSLPHTVPSPIHPLLANLPVKFTYQKIYFKRMTSSLR